MKLIDLSNIKKQYPDLTVYRGAFDIEEPKVDFDVDEFTTLGIFLKEIYNSDWINYISIEDLKHILRLFAMKATIYPSGNFTFGKLDSSDDELKQCFLLKTTKNTQKYYVAIALEETQPTLYKVQLVGIILE